MRHSILIRVPALGIALATALMACSPPGALSDSERAAIRAEVEQELRRAYDLSRPGIAERMLALYPDSGRVVSASAGRVMTSRDSLRDGIRYFWDNVGVNMREPTWVWDAFHTDVLAHDVAVVTATYHIPHRNPRNEPHVLGGAMTVVMHHSDGRWRIVQEHLSDRSQ